MMVCQTEKLCLRHITKSDSPFILELLNDASYIQSIRDSGVRTIPEAEDYILKTYSENYHRFGFGLFLVELKESQTPLGICGLVKRETLPDIDIGFAFLPRYWGKGYALNSSLAILDYARNNLKLHRVLAITSSHNLASIKVLQKLGMRFDRMIKLSPDQEELKFFVKIL